MLACGIDPFDNAATMSPAQVTKTPPSDDESKGYEKAPLQLRLARQDIRAIKIAAAESELTISDFLLGCFRSWQATTAASGPSLPKPQR